MKTAILFLLVLALSGCAVTIPIGTPTPKVRISRTEMAWQILNAADFAQTVTIARQPNSYGEGGFPTAAVIGHHPSERNVELFWAVQSTTHLLVSNWLDRQVEATGSARWATVRTTWTWAGLGMGAYNVVHNAQMGLGAFGGREIARARTPDEPVHPRHH